MIKTKKTKKTDTEHMIESKIYWAKQILIQYGKL